MTVLFENLIIFDWVFYFYYILNAILLFFFLIKFLKKKIRRTIKKIWKRYLLINRIIFLEWKKNILEPSVLLIIYYWLTINLLLILNIISFIWNMITYQNNIDFFMYCLFNHAYLPDLKVGSLLSNTIFSDFIINIKIYFKANFTVYSDTSFSSFVNGIISNKYSFTTLNGNEKFLFSKLTEEYMSNHYKEINQIFSELNSFFIANNKIYKVNEFTYTSLITNQNFSLPSIASSSNTENFTLLNVLSQKIFINNEQYLTTKNLDIYIKSLPYITYKNTESYNTYVYDPFFFLTKPQALKANDFILLYKTQFALKKEGWILLTSIDNKHMVINLIPYSELSSHMSLFKELINGTTLNPALKNILVKGYETNLYTTHINYYYGNLQFIEEKSNLLFQLQKSNLSSGKLNSFENKNSELLSSVSFQPRFKLKAPIGSIEYNNFISSKINSLNK